MSKEQSFQMTVPGQAQAVHVSPIDYAGRMFNRFWAQRDQMGPGWFIMGRNAEYGDKLIKTCAHPAKPRRKNPLYNVSVYSGWTTKREAQAVADYLNSPEGVTRIAQAGK